MRARMTTSPPAWTSGLLLLALLLSAATFRASAAPASSPSTNAPTAATGLTNLVRALLSEDPAEQTQLIQTLIGASHPLVPQALTAWRGGAVFILETNNARIP